LRDKAALIVLDSCEHVIDAAAALAEAVLKAAPGVSILTTSREPLRAEGESLHRLAALELPSGSVDLAAGDALRYSAVQLFNERASAAVDGFALGDADVPAALEICRRLDGIPLALELAAARVGAFGVRDLAAHLDDRFRLLTTGRRTALPRHQTLGATLDWSYQLLPKEERAVLLGSAYSSAISRWRLPSPLPPILVRPRLSTTSRTSSANRWSSPIFAATSRSIASSTPPASTPWKS
jgi:predicted ATPase